MNKIKEKAWINKELYQRRILYSFFFLGSINSNIKKCDELRERKFVLKNWSKKASNGKIRETITNQIKLGQIENVEKLGDLIQEWLDNLCSKVYIDRLGKLNHGKFRKSGQHWIPAHSISRTNNSRQALLFPLRQLLTKLIDSLATTTLTTNKLNS